MRKIEFHPGAKLDIAQTRFVWGWLPDGRSQDGELQPKPSMDKLAGNFGVVRWRLGVAFEVYAVNIKYEAA